MHSKFKASIFYFTSLLYGCTDKPPVAEQDANVYQKAVYYSSHRPYADRKRDRLRKPAEILEFAGIESGETVIDLLGGGGWYTEILSEVVGETGQVYLVNSPLFLKFSNDEMTRRLRNQRLKNVTRIDSEWNALELPTGVDTIVLVLAYHDIYVPRPNHPSFEADPEMFFRQIREALKPSGKVLVIDHAAVPDTGSSHAKTLHRIEESFAIADFDRHGFKLAGTTQVLRNPADDFTLDIWQDKVRGKTDRFVHLYIKQELSSFDSYTRKST